MMDSVPFRILSESEQYHRGVLLTEAYIPYLRERHPMGSVAAINVLTAGYVVGCASPQAIYMYRDKFGERAEANMWLEPIHWPNTRPWDEEHAELKAWFDQRKATRS